VVGVTFTDFEDSGVSIKSDAETLDFLGVDSFELKVKLVSGSLVRDAVEGSSLHAGVLVLLIRGHLNESQLVKSFIT